MAEERDIADINKRAGQVLKHMQVGLSNTGNDPDKYAQVVNAQKDKFNPFPGATQIEWSWAALASLGKAPEELLQEFAKDWGYLRQLR